MTDRAAHLVDHVLPAVAIRQYVPTLPPRLRYQLPWDHALCRAVVAVALRAVLGWLRRQARRRGVVRGRGGAVAVVQRFGAALNLNVHIHALVLDGVFAPDASGGVSARAHERHDDTVGPLLVTIQRRIEALLHRRGVPDGREGVDAPDRWAEDAPALAGLAAASVHGVAALGARAGAPVRRWGDTIEVPNPPAPSRWHARRRLTDGTTHLVFDPVELLERLAALTPRPRINLILYHGVLAPRAAWRRAVVPACEDPHEWHGCATGATGTNGHATTAAPQSHVGETDAAQLWR